jgi:hypothetical protein
VDDEGGNYHILIYVTLEPAEDIRQAFFATRTQYNIVACFN